MTPLTVPRWAWYAGAGLGLYLLMQYVSCSAERRGRDQARAFTVDSVAGIFLRQEALHRVQDSAMWDSLAHTLRRQTILRERANALAHGLTGASHRADSLTIILLQPSICADSSSVLSLRAIADSALTGLAASQRALIVTDSAMGIVRQQIESAQTRLAKADSLIQAQRETLRAIRPRRPPILPWAVAVLAVLAAIFR